MTINKERVLSIVRFSIAGTALNQNQKDGFSYFLSKIEQTEIDKRWIAYILATVWHETLHTMHPVSEKGNYKHFRNYEYLNGNIFLGDGFRYRGRGYVPLAWRDNYEKFGRFLGLELVGNPDCVLNPEIAWRILFTGMTEGLFTGEKLLKYFNEVNTDWIEARKIIHDSDDAEQIAEQAKKFFEAL
ncbi:MAG: hypothetical protein HGA62_03255 [Chlorobiaceae bacterium]|nr:hypothetical protein [Chlorobiaceae bacterium]NTV60353.1 hypothetical protein [Chlorobiaceae bacterium]